MRSRPNHPSRSGRCWRATRGADRTCWSKRSRSGRSASTGGVSVRTCARISPKARLALHVHPGTQIAYIDKGTLTYTVKTGAVTVYRGQADKGPRLVRRVTAGHTAKVRAGQWLIEKPHVQHFGANLGSKPIVILAATLLKNGQPPAIP